MMRVWVFVLVLAACGCTPIPTPQTDIHSSPFVRPADVTIDFDANHILSHSIEGDAGVQGRPVKATDPVRIASISKLVIALGVMRLVDQKRLNLDRDVGDYLGMKVRNPAFPDTVITLRLLMSHQSSLTDAAEYILPLDADLSTSFANPKAWDLEHPPGTYFRYSNFNFPVIAAIMEGATQERFDRLMARLVFIPMKMDACFNWQAGCSAGRRAQAVTLLRPNRDLAKDGPGSIDCVFNKASDGSCDISRYRLGRNGSAFGPQGGLRISARDLARIGQVLLKRGKPLLSDTAYTEMTTPSWTFNGRNGDDEQGFFHSYGLSVELLTDSKGNHWIGHVGEAYSLRAGLWVNPATGKGRIRYTTMVAEDAPVGHCLEVCP